MELSHRQDVVEVGPDPLGQTKGVCPSPCTLNSFDLFGELFFVKNIDLIGDLDNLISRMARQNPGNQTIAQWILRKTIETISRSGIPGALYLRYQNGLANRIGKLFESVESVA